MVDNNLHKIFNYRLSRARRVVENAFGILLQKFRIYDRRLNLKPDFAQIVILTTCILHNFIRSTVSLNVRHYNDSEVGSDRNNIFAIHRQGGNAQNSAFEIRNTFAEYFLSAEGRIEWQDEM